MSEYRIPISHERGTYTLTEVEVTDEYNDDTMVIKCDDCDIITNSMNDIAIYNFKDELHNALVITYHHPMKYNSHEQNSEIDVTASLTALFSLIYHSNI